MCQLFVKLVNQWTLTLLFIIMFQTFCSNIRYSATQSEKKANLLHVALALEQYEQYWVQGTIIVYYYTQSIVIRKRLVMLERKCLVTVQ